MKKRKGFTLIELIAVLVIMAILALIVTPIVMSIIRKAKISADKRSIDAYGRSIELAVAGYLLDNGTFPTTIDQLTIEYSGDEVVCSQTQLNPDSTVYLTGCRVGGRSIDYEYGDNQIITYNTYSVGDEVTYNGVNYYVIKDSKENEETVTLLKAEPLSPNEVTLYGGEHINRYAQYYQGRVCENNGYGGIAYYSSSTCTFDPVYDGCTTNYAESDIKYIVDSWSQDKVGNGLVEARLLTMDDLVNNLGCDHAKGVVSSATGTLSSWHIDLEYTPIWVYSRDYSYWTMSPVDDSSYRVWGISYDGYLDRNDIFSSCGAVRPVITISKTNLSS